MVSGGDVLFQHHPDEVEFPISIKKLLGPIREHDVLIDPGEAIGQFRGVRRNGFPGS